MGTMTMTAEQVVRDFLAEAIGGDREAAGLRLAPDVHWLREREGAWTDGADALLDEYRNGIDGTSDPFVRVESVRTVELGDVAVVSGLLAFGGVYEGTPYEVPCPATFVVGRAGGDWRIVHHHTLALPRESTSE